MDDLLRLFGEATHHQSVDKTDPTAGATTAAAVSSSLPSGTENPLHEGAENRELDPVDLDAPTTRDSFSLVQAKSLSVKLAQVR